MQLRSDYEVVIMLHMQRAETHIQKFLPTEGPRHSWWYLNALIISAVRVYHGTACSRAAKYVTFSYFNSTFVTH